MRTSVVRSLADLLVDAALAPGFDAGVDQALTRLGSVIGFDSAAVCENDRSGAPQYIRFAADVELPPAVSTVLAGPIVLDPWSELVVSTGDSQVRAWSEYANWNDLDRNAGYQLAYRPLGLRWALHVPLPTGGPVQRVLVLARRRGSSDFSPADRATAVLLREPLARILREHRSRSLVGVVLAPARAEVEHGETAAGFTVRQAQVAELVADGLTDGQIARRLVISPRTVHHHLEAIRARTGAVNRVAVAIAWLATR